MSIIGPCSSTLMSGEIDTLSVTGFFFGNKKFDFWSVFLFSVTSLAISILSIKSTPA